MKAPTKTRKSLSGSSSVKNTGRFPVVGIGASAGGLEALKQFLSALQLDTGMAFVLIQHLDPKHESLSAEILARVTKLPVAQVKDGDLILKDHVYVIPSNFTLGIYKGILKLLPRPEEHGKQKVIDSFFESLGEDQEEYAIGVVLSGTGSDGTEGIRQIKAAGGVTIAQKPETAKFGEMPKNAIASGMIDLVLSPEDIAAELTRISRHEHFIPVPHESESEGLENDYLTTDFPRSTLAKIFLLLRDTCHVDFSHYKGNTINRRLYRRMLFRRIEKLDDYLSLLTTDEDEVKALYADILIHVTRFFRDPDAYDVLVTTVFPKLLANQAPGLPIRVWVPGCSTGEEVYSLAIALTEFVNENAPNTPIQIFGSDISEPSIQKARQAEYSSSISKDVSEVRLKRYFTLLENGLYKVSKSIRDVCLFSRHDVTVDPPFAKLDLVSCRNLLIYLTPTLQKHIIPLFHYALRPGGYLWLGRSETIGSYSNLFSLEDKYNKTYLRKNTSATAYMNFPARNYVPAKPEAMKTNQAFPKAVVDVQKISDQALQNEYPGVLINEEMEVLQFRGRTAPFLEPAAGAANFHLLKMARPEFAPDLRLLLQTAKKQNGMVKKIGLTIKDGKRLLSFDLKVIPINPASDAPGASSRNLHFLVLFENQSASSPSKKKAPASKSKKAITSKERSELLELRQELLSSHEYQSSLIERYEATQEDLSMANEELQSANEELQSSNEELETAKEELQSSNEELTTVNDELQSRSLEQIHLSNDLTNLLGSVKIPILMLDSESRIRRFTPLAASALNLITADIGRPISDLKLYFTAPEMDLDLDHLVKEVLATMTLKELEIQDKHGHWFRLQIRPYKTIENKIDGTVLTFVDIDVLKQSLKEVKASRAEAEKANRGKDLFLATLSHELRTPLTSILSWVQMIRMGKLTPEKTMRAMEIIEESGKAQAQLINDLLDVSRIIAGKIALELTEVNPSTCVKAAIEAVSHTAAAKSIKIEMKMDHETGTVLADPVRLQQIFWNLLTNAVKFSAPESVVIVQLSTVKAEGGAKAQAKIQVIDSGKGIDPEFLPYIFDRFSQEDGSSVRLHGGLGLGLAIVRNLVELHGGKINVETPGEKPGATFTVLLPLKSRSPLPIADDSKKQNDVSLQGICVLIVDDEANTREAFKEILQAFGAEVYMAENVEDSLLLLGQTKPDIIVTDIAMPNQDGFSLIKKVRSRTSSEGGSIPMIAVTAYAAYEEVKNIIEAGFQAHIPKPLDGRHLARTIERLVVQKRKG